MRRKPYPIIDLSGGTNTNLGPYLINDHESPYTNNCRIEKGVLKKMWGASAYTTTSIDGTPMLFAIYYPHGADPVTFLFTTTNSYKLVSEAWSEVTRVAGDFTGDYSNRFIAVNMNDLLIVTNGLDAPQKWTNGNSNFSLLGGTPPDMVSFVPFMNHLVGVGINDGTYYPYRIQWSTSGDPETWAGGTSGDLDLVDTPDICTHIALLHGKAYIFKERTIWELAHVGGTEIFRPQLIINGVGTYSPNTVVEYEDMLIFKSRDNVYTFDGQRVEPIGSNIKELSSNIPASYACTAMAHHGIEEYWLAVPTTGTYPDLLCRYNMKHKSWFMSYSVDITAFGSSIEQDSGTPWEDIPLDGSHDWANYPGTWFSTLSSEGLVAILYAERGGDCYKYNFQETGSETFTFQTKDFIFGQETRIALVQIRARYGAFDVSYSTDEGDTWSDSISFAASVADWKEYQWMLNFTCTSIRFRVQSTASEFELQWIEPWYIPRTRIEDLTYPS